MGPIAVHNADRPSVKRRVRGIVTVIGENGESSGITEIDDRDVYNATDMAVFRTIYRLKTTAP